MNEPTKEELEYARTSHSSSALLSNIVQAAQDRGCNIHTDNKKWHGAAVAMIDAYVEEILHIYSLTVQKPPFTVFSGREK